ncbi:MAG: hypothetical protein Q8O92_16690 [Candidatus Latescibacter sp.]|nr:hypothetical protein [Candidatus Latescibacter sp.]
MNRRIFFASLILVAVSSLVMVPTLMAQQRGTPLTPEERVANIEKAIKLTADQKTQILKIYTDAAANAQSGGGGGRGGGFMGGGMLPAAVEKALTPDQVKKYNAFTRQQSIDGTITRINEAVTLTDDQKKKIVPIIEKQLDAQAAVRAERAKQVAAGETPDNQAMMDKMTAIRDEMVKSLGTVLNKDQLEKYNAMPRGGRGGGRGGQ